MIQALAELQFMRPQWLWLLLALPLLALWWIRRQRREDAWRRRVDPHLLPHLLAPRSGRRRGAGVLLGVWTLGLAILALAGPGWRAQSQPLYQQASPLVVALDLSSATTTGDLPPNRLLQARAAIDSLLAARAGGQVALVAFAGDAHTVAPLTGDADNVRVFLDALAPDIMPTDGSDPARAIRWSVGLLERGGLEQGDILILTHDADADARRAAAAAARTGYTVSVLGLGTDAGAMHRDGGGRLVHSRMDAAALQALAEAGSGRFAALEAGDASELAGLGSGGPVDRAGTGATGGERADQGYWLLLPLMLLAALAFRRGAGLLVVALALGLPLVPANAQDLPEALEGGLWQRADQQAHERSLAAVEAYRRGDYLTAAEIWAGLPGADDAYNRGNALAQAGRLEEALAAYDQALARQPDLEDALENRRIVEEALEQEQSDPDSRSAGDDDGAGAGEDEGDGTAQPRPPEDGNPQDDGRQGEGGAENAQQDQEQPADGPPEEGESGGQGEGTPEPTDDTGGEGPSAPDPADPDAQREADEALRQQMQQTMEEGGAAEEGTDENAPAPAGAPADIREQEQREAAEAWLRRIPDDPGGLLRARFRLEHERRARGGAD